MPLCLLHNSDSRPVKRQHITAATISESDSTSTSILCSCCKCMWSVELFLCSARQLKTCSSCCANVCFLLYIILTAANRWKYNYQNFLLSSSTTVSVSVDRSDSTSSVLCSCCRHIQPVELFLHGVRQLKTCSSYHENVCLLLWMYITCYC